MEETNKLIFHINEDVSKFSGTDYHAINRRRKNFCPKELNIIITAVEAHADLIYNKLNCHKIYDNKHDFWVKVTHTINETCHLASQRDVKEVRRKWVTFQSEVKSKAKDGVYLLNINEHRVYDLIQANQSDLSMMETFTMISAEDQGIMGSEQAGGQSTAVSTEASITLPVLPPVTLPLPSSPGIKSEIVSDAEMLVNICSQVIGELSKEQPVSLPQANKVTPTRNVVPVQSLSKMPLNCPPPAKRGRMEPDEQGMVDYFSQLVDLQRQAVRLQEQRLLVDTQRRDIEKEKLDIEKARYEIEKERLCQEIISRKK